MTTLYHVACKRDLVRALRTAVLLGHREQERALRDQLAALRQRIHDAYRPRLSADRDPFAEGDE